jgi:YHS domain-containing protein
MVLGVVLAALAACSTQGRLLHPDPEKDHIVSKESKTIPHEREADPVCGASLEGADFAWQSTYQGHDFYFDSEECQREFDANPDLYLKTAR